MGTGPRVCLQGLLELSATGVGGLSVESIRAPSSPMPRKMAAAGRSSKRAAISCCHGSSHSSRDDAQTQNASVDHPLLWQFLPKRRIAAAYRVSEGLGSGSQNGRRLKKPEDLGV